MRLGQWCQCDCSGFGCIQSNMTNERIKWINSSVRWSYLVLSKPWTRLFPWKEQSVNFSLSSTNIWVNQIHKKTRWIWFRTIFLSQSTIIIPEQKLHESRHHCQTGYTQIEVKFIFAWHQFSSTKLPVYDKICINSNIIMWMLLVFLGSFLYASTRL